ncbi:MAG: M28 family peptidase, partial [Candidatus Aminicenantes bacterium]|nr:M28 family peptidase [Candidatus Aminicenantes bacterium]
MKRRLTLGLIIVATAAGIAAAQYTPWLYWTLLPREQMDLIAGEASGETARRTVMDINGYNRERNDAEYAGNFWETQVIVAALKSYGLTNVEIAAYPSGEAWRGLRGELWELSPFRQKLASYQDEVGMLVNGSRPADVTAELVWVGGGSKAEIEAAGVAGKIVVTDGSASAVHTEACLNQGALGVISIAMSRPYFDPLQMPWSGLRGRRPPAGAQGTAEAEPKFAFQLPVREGDYLKKRLLAREKITVRAVVESKMETVDLENVIALIPGTEPDSGEVILSAHLFEGFAKQGANDNTSGSAVILEAARTLNALIRDGLLPRPRRSIRFIWGPEFSGIGRWVQENQPVMEKTLCNINMDMVGEWLSKNQAFFCLMRTTFGNPHYINDVMENYYRYIGEAGRERIQNRSRSYPVPVRIISPFGADEPFHYAIETHYGASDHEVFNNWGVGVPGIMMIAWPDRWYHTTGDVSDKSDATQLKRAAAIGAAGAYTVAAADEAMAVKIAAEISGNAVRRLGHALTVGLEKLNAADAAGFTAAYAAARGQVEAAVINEKDTLDSVLELAADKTALAAYIAKAKRSIEGVGNAGLASLKTHMETLAGRFGSPPVKLVPSELEKKAAALIPRPTAKVREKGYNGYAALINAVPAEIKAKYPSPRAGEFAVASTAEVQLLVDGRHSVLDIKKMLDAQNEQPSTL